MTAGWRADLAELQALRRDNLREQQADELREQRDRAGEPGWWPTADDRDRARGET